MYYLATIGYETEQLDKNGDPRLQKLKYIIEAESVEEVTVISAKYRAGDTRASDLLSVAQMPIECIIGSKTTPEYYKK
jgi:hypothetical protein